jgi:membrane carboxypeptidase/penicillin-binding protein
VRPVDLAAFYATIANEGLRPVPHVVESIEQSGQTIFRHESRLETIGSVDRAAFYQLKSMLQGVLARGTAHSIAGLSAYVAGKTGTSDDENDAWFVGFTNDVTIAVWLGYDNADGKRRTLGHGGTGGSLAVPIFASVVDAAWMHIAPRTVLAPPSAEAKIALSCTSVSSQVGSSKSRDRTESECLRVNAKGKVVDAEYRLVSRGVAVAKRHSSEEGLQARETRQREAQQREFWGGGQSWGWGWESQPRRDWRGGRRAEPNQLWGNWR